MIHFYFIKGREAVNFSDFIYPEDRKRAEAGNIYIVGAVDDETAVGALTWGLKGDVAQIYSIVLADAYQGKGIARQLLSFFKERVILFDAYEIQADLLASDSAFCKLDDLFRQEGFTVHEGSLFFQMSLADLSLLPIMGKVKEDRTGSIKKLAAISQRERFKFQNHMMKSGKLMSELDWSLFDEELSFLGFRESKAVCGLFISDQGTGVHVEWIYVEMQNAPLFFSAMKAVVNAVEARYGREVQFSGVLATEKSEEFFIKLVGDRKERVTGQRGRQYRCELIETISNQEELWT